MTVRAAPKTSLGSNRIDISTRSGGSCASRRCDGVSTTPLASDMVSGEKVWSHRGRQVSVASILEVTFGTLAARHPGLWDQPAYLRLVGLVYDRLASSEAEIPTDELVALAKVLGGSHRAAVRGEDLPPKPTAKGIAMPRKGNLPREFAQLVRQVYGAELQSPSEEAVVKAAPTRESADVPD